jgi:hypothetical protein
MLAERGQLPVQDHPVKSYLPAVDAERAVVLEVIEQLVKVIPEPCCCLADVLLVLAAGLFRHNCLLSGPSYRKRNKAIT